MPMEVGKPMPIPDMSVGPIFPNGNEPPAIPPGVDPIEPNEISLPPDEAVPSDISPRPLQPPIAEAR